MTASSSAMLVSSLSTNPSSHTCTDPMVFVTIALFFSSELEALEGPGTRFEVPVQSSTSLQVQLSSHPCGGAIKESILDWRTNRIF